MTTRDASPLTAEFVGRLRAFVRRRVRGDADADDVVQDVLAKLVTKGETVPAGSVHAWLFTVARRAVIDRFRTAKPAAELPAEVAAPGFGPDDRTAAADLARCLDPMMAGLRDEERDILARVDMAGESQAAIARELGVSVSAVKSRVQRARARLRATLDACCAVEHDRRGEPIEFARRDNQACPCSGGAGGCDGRN
ncbi:MAG TPA: sigma-70 family RNA polymerase sigma factor [Gemmataceae bacterium]|jgi:RNA polymerase sigma-70 factor (ECF subfamily)|nr:sigma-70 family RNA polymerase sigma factor [Gemmataceae bacterium]